MFAENLETTSGLPILMHGVIYSETRRHMFNCDRLLIQLGSSVKVSRPACTCTWFARYSRTSGIKPAFWGIMVSSHL